MRHVTISTVLGLMITALPAAPASAQQGAAVPRADLNAGVAFWVEDDPNVQYEGLHIGGGWRAWRHVSVIGDLAMYGEGRNTLMGGARFHVGPFGRAEPFVQILYGSAPHDDIALQPGAGVDILLARQIGVRLAADFKYAGDDGSTFYGRRLSAGIIVQLGRR